MDLSLHVRRHDCDVVLTITGEIDIDSGPWLEEHVRMLGTSGSRLLLDLSGVTFIDCAGLRILLATCRRAERRACSVRFIAISHEVEWLADLAGLRDEFRWPNPGVPEQECRKLTLPLS
jgi:anti-anti-sigma factor